MNFASIYQQGFVRVAAVTVPTRIADPAANASAIIEQLGVLDIEGVSLAVFPELGLSGYSIDDLLLAAPLLDGCISGIGTIVAATRNLTPVVAVGAPLQWRNRVYNCAVVIHRGVILGVVPKSYLPNYREFYERRHFAPGDDIADWINLAGQTVPFGPDLLFTASDLTNLTIHVEVCEDLWVPIPPSSEAALAGATVLANLSGSPITVGRAEDRKLLARASSSRGLAAYLFAAAGAGESTTDLSWDGQTFVYENGDLLGESERFAREARATIADVDLDRLIAERVRQGSFDDNRRAHAWRVDRFRRVPFTLNPPDRDIGLRRHVDRFPFVPDDADRLAQDCYEAYNIQVAGLVRRIESIGNAKPILGVSGGLDSTQALIVAAKAMDLLGRPRSDILAFTMPGFATTEHTKSNAEALSLALGVTFSELDIRPAAMQMLTDMGHPFARGEEVYDITFENVQAGLRYDYLFRLANQRGGIVVGTGDLSELALGWCTYGVGDHMSHYAVNTGVPKTLMQHLIRWVIASGQFDEPVNGALDSILDTEITPELIPTKQGEKPQSTRDSIGPYELHDFALFHVLRHGYGPAKIAFLAHHAWRDVQAGRWPVGFPEDERIGYDLPTIKGWLTVFCKRFFGNQFKRSALPNGPKVMAGGSLSPRGDWRMPSDATAKAWLDELERDVPSS